MNYHLRFKGMTIFVKNNAMKHEPNYTLPEDGKKLTFWRYLKLNPQPVLWSAIILGIIVTCYLTKDEFWDPKFAVVLGNLFILALVVIVILILMDFIEKRDD